MQANRSKVWETASEPNIAGQCHGFSMLNKPGLRI
ncbi:protein of unknown function [Paraburkholderia kururiensis]